MSNFSGDLVEVGVAIESTRGTRKAPQFGVRWGDFTFSEKVATAVDESRSGIIEDSRGSYVTGTMSEGDLEAPMHDNLIGAILLATLGSAADAVVESGVYDHTFDVDESNQHPSLTIHKKDPNGGFDHTLSMIDSLEINVTPENLVNFKASVRGRAKSDPGLGNFTVTIATPGVVSLTAHGLVTGDAVTLETSGALPTGLAEDTTYFVIYNDADSFWLATSLANALAGTKINTSGSQSGTHSISLVYRYITYASSNLFAGNHATFKLASSQSGLGAASAINVRSAKLTIDKNPDDERTIGSVVQADIYNRLFTVALEVELVADDQTYVDYLLNGTYRAARLDFSRSDITIGSASSPRLYFDFYRLSLQEAPQEYKRGEMTSQTLTFKAHYSESDAKMIRAILRNTTASY